MQINMRAFSHFNPPAPCGAGRVCKFEERWRKQFQSTRPVWGGTIATIGTAAVIEISIHPPRVGRDVRRNHTADCRPISIHPPRVGRDSHLAFIAWAQSWNSSAPSVRAVPRLYSMGKGRYNPSSPCRGTPFVSRRNSTTSQASTIPSRGDATHKLRTISRSPRRSRAAPS